MASFIVNTGITDTTAKTVSNNDIGTIQAGGTLTAATAITWTGGSNAPGVVIDNSGAINGGTRAIDSSGAFAAGGSITVNNNAGATISATGNDAWRVNTSLNAGGTITLNNAGLMTSAGGQTLDFEAVTSVNANVNINNASTGTIRSTSSDAIRPGAGDISIDNSGLIESTVARGINLNTTNLTNITSFALTNDAGATIRGLTDAVRITAGTLSPTATGTFVIDNAGTIESVGTGGSNGQALDLNDLVSPLGSVTITNQSTGILRAADADAVRTGTNATVNNYGQIISLNGTPASDGNDGIDFQANTGGAVNNFAGGVIDGARHGITGDAPIAVTNGGTIIGRVGAGINMDTASTTTTTVTNTGTITGITVEGVQSGDSVDVDGLVHLDNYGLIEALGTRVGGLSEGVTVGGGTINNFAGGTIVSSQRGITVDGGGNLDGTSADAFAAATIYNEGTIQGDNGEAIVIVGSFADTVTNRGTIAGSIATAGGDDILNLYTGSSISGVIDAGLDADTINLLGSGQGSLADFVNVETINLTNGDWTLGSDGVSTLAFQAGAQTLRLASTVLADGDFDGTIDNFVAGDTIDLQSIGLATSATLGAGNLLTIAGGTSGPVTLQLDASEDYAGFVFRLKSDGNGGTTITLGKNVNGGNGNDSLTGTEGDDHVNGGNGNDALAGLGGDDILSGGNGNDTIEAGDGNDALDGGNGDDIMTAGAGNDTLDGGNGDDIMNAGADNDSLSGGNGNDIMVAGDGNDSLSGGNGNDTMNGGSGNDSLSGGNGNDSLTGGAGDDVMSGGNGNDLFVFDAGFGHDTITGFQTVDRIQFDSDLFANFSSVLAASQQVGADTVITLDADNAITLQNVQLNSLQANDFLFV
jgi:RTX calcium-binding nonapeptide repeat (4 copies)